MKLRRPSPALVISIVALVAACAGSAVAATVITSKQIRNGTIQNIDIKNGHDPVEQVLQGRAEHPQEEVGGGSAGGIVAYETVRKAGPENQPANQQLRVTSLTIPAGAYVVTANTIMTAFTGTTNVLEALFDANGSLGGTCTLDAGGVERIAVRNDRHQRPPDADDAGDAADAHRRRADGVRR